MRNLHHCSQTVKDQAYQIASETNVGIWLYCMGSVWSVSEIMARTGPAQGSTLCNKDVLERGRMRNQGPKATKLANSRKKKTSS